MSSGLKPGVITLHMALAIILICVFVYIIYRGGQRLPSVNLGSQKGLLRSTLIILFVACVVEGIMGSQVREITDELALKGHSRNVWHEILEQKASIFFIEAFMDYLSARDILILLRLAMLMEIWRNYPSRSLLV